MYTQIGDRLKLLNRALLHQEQAGVGDRRTRDVKLFDTRQRSLSTQGEERPKTKKNNDEHEVKVEVQAKMVKKIPTMQEICSNLGLMPATPPNKTLPVSPNQSRWSIAGFSRGDAHSANRKTSARPSSTATPISRNENSQVSPADLASETRASWQVCRTF
jgi:hypothetical protein